jgi:hypothetical protein
MLRNVKAPRWANPRRDGSGFDTHAKISKQPIRVQVRLLYPIVAGVPIYAEVEQC